MKPRPSPPPHPPRGAEVPRDPEPDRPAPGAARPGTPPVPHGDEVRDEDYTSEAQPLRSDAPVGHHLHKHPSKVAAQLDVGTGGDAARPGKEGISGKPIPPRGRL